jgi:hypothetical protein
MQPQSLRVGDSSSVVLEALPQSAACHPAILAERIRSWIEVSNSIFEG